MAAADTSIMMRRVSSRPSASDSHPETIRPPVLPIAPTEMPSVAAVAPKPASRANGTNWLIVIRPAVVPRQ